MEKVEKCPDCGKPMEKGFLIGARGIYWNESIPSGFCTGIVIAKSASPYQWKCPNIPAYRCMNCKIILIRTPEMEMPKTPDELYEQLLNVQMRFYVGGKPALEHKIESIMKQGLSREEAIRKLAEKEKLI